VIHRKPWKPFVEPAISPKFMAAYSDRLTALFKEGDAFQEIWRQDGMALMETKNGETVPTTKVHFGYTDGISMTTIRGGPERYMPDHQQPCEPWLFVLLDEAENYFVPTPRELGLAQLQARRPLKPYQQLRYWSTVPFRHGANEAVKQSATPSLGNLARPLQRQKPDALQDELVHHVEEDNVMSSFDISLQLLGTTGMRYAGQRRDTSFWIENASIEWDALPHGRSAYAYYEVPALL
jgi:hypothetical protein